MCGRSALWHGARELDNLFDVAISEELKPRYDIRPTDLMLIVRERDGERELVSARWSLLPRGFRGDAKQANKFNYQYRTFNAQAERLTDSRLYQGPFQRQRCLIPTSGFYEWPEGQRHYIHINGKPPFAMAGLWQTWLENGEPRTSCTVITVQANALMERMHPTKKRMPVILEPSDYALWLDPDVQDPDLLEPLLRPYPDERMDAYPVAASKGDDPKLIEPLKPT